MKSIDYLGNEYRQFIGDLAVDSSDEANILIALNGVGRRNINAIINDILRATKKTLHVSRNSIHTEASLSRMLAETDNNLAILFFDEADALFGKRSEVKDSQDRYANIEVAYLLKNIENFKGIMIFASNKRKTLNSSLISKVNVLIQTPFFLTIIRRIRQRWVNR